MVKVFLVSFMLVVVFLLAGCNQQPEDGDLTSFSTYSDPLDIHAKEFRRYHDSLYTHYIQLNPDSAINQIFILIRYFDSIGFGPFVLENYFALSEIYLREKPDDYLASFYFAEGLKTLDKYRLSFNLNLNPYHLIDLGNLLFKHKLYRYAINNYQQSEKLALKTGNWYAEAVSFNNLGLSYQELKIYDSARICFNKSLKIRKAHMPLLSAHNYLYLARLGVEQNFPDSVFIYCEKAGKAVAQQVFEKKYMQGLNLEGATALSNEITTMLPLLKGWYYENRKDSARLDLAEKLYREAIENAIKYMHYDLLDEIRPKLASLLIHQKRYRESLTLLDSAYLDALNEKKFDLALNVCKMASAISDAQFNPAMQYKWIRLQTMCADSLLKIENSEEQISRKIVLLSVQTDQSIKLLNLIRQKNEATIRTQTQGIIFLLALVFLVVIFLAIVIHQREKLHKANLKLVEKTVHLLDTQPETTRIIQVSSSPAPFPQLKQALDNLVRESSVYLDPEINLGKLAQSLNTNEKYLSQLINQQYNVSFTEFINNLRVKKACQILSDPTSRAKSFDQIANESGFQSKSTFYAAFKKVTGVTPLFFQKNAQIAVSQSV